MRILKAINLGSNSKRIGFRNQKDWERYAENMLDQLEDLFDQSKSLVTVISTGNSVEVFLDGDKITEDTVKHVPDISNDINPISIDNKTKKELSKKLHLYHKLSEWERTWQAQKASRFQLEYSLREQGGIKKSKAMQKMAVSMEKKKKNLFAKIEKQVFTQVSKLQKLPKSLKSFVKDLVGGMESLFVEQDGKTKFFESLTQKFLVDVDYYDDAYAQGEIVRYTVYLEFSNVSDPVEPNITVPKVVLGIVGRAVLGARKPKWRLGINVAYRMIPPEDFMRGLVNVDINMSQKDLLPLVMRLLQSAVAPNLMSYYGVDVGPRLKKKFNLAVPNNLTLTQVTSTDFNPSGYGVMKFKLLNRKTGLVEAKYEILQALSLAGVMDSFVVRQRLDPIAKDPIIVELHPRRDPTTITYENYYRILEILNIKEDSPDDESFWEWVQSLNIEVESLSEVI